ncbi:MAG: NAD-dependent epimerase/dehydratase family protein [Lactobacillales bacterium]|jgi:UDP-glucose 4-epimerase|nr:NAD-dependent epimerase/dehydratase family protein [Lactobacillales bacterium]
MTILVTGGAGFIGSNLVNFLASENQVVVIDDLSMGKIENLDKSFNIEFIKGSVTDNILMKKLLKEKHFDYIFHLAAIASVADSVENPIKTHKVNFDSVFLLLELIRKYQKSLQRLVFSSSAAVYGDEVSLPKKEKSVIRPLTAYAIDKFAAERFVLMYSNLYKVPTSVVRFFNVYGPKQNPSSPYSGVISIMMDCFLKIQTNIEAKFTLFGNGKQSRDFVFVEDVLKALMLVSKSNSAIGEVYNVGTGHAVTLLDLISIIEKTLGFKLPVIYEDLRLGDISESLADISKLQTLGYKPANTISRGIDKYIKYLTSSNGYIFE